MTKMPDNCYDRFNEPKNYEKLLFRDGYTLQGAELNEAQSSSMSRLKAIADALFADGDVIRDARIIVNAETGAVQAQSGAVYLRGAVRGVAPADFVIPTTGTVAIGLRLVETVVSELDDPALYNPAIGSRGEGEPGAWRLRVDAVWGFDPGEVVGDAGEFYPVYTVDDGELRAKEAPPALDSFTQSIAKYDRDSTGGGSYVVDGLSVQMAEDVDAGQVYTIAEGRARVNGYGVDLPTSRRLIYPAVADLRRIDTEVHIATANAMKPGGQRITVAHPPLAEIEGLRMTTRKTVSVVHGAYSGCADALPDTAIVSIVECRQGNTVYAAGNDYKKTGDTVDWSPSGAEPATGSTFSVTYDCIAVAVPKNVDADGFSVEGAVNGTSILLTYKQAVPRLDRLCLTQEGQFIWLQGIATERNPRTPAVPDNLLPIATIHQTWRTGVGGRSVNNDGVRVVPFAEIERINQRIDGVTREVARNRLETDVATREAGGRAGLFVDPLLDDSMRDQGIEQTAAIVGGCLTLPVTARVFALSADVTVPSGAPWTPRVFLEQPFRTGFMRVNPYDAFDPMPGRATLTPAVDRWTETRTDWTSTVTQRFDVSLDGYFHIVRQRDSNSRTETMGNSTSSLEFLRPITVSFRVEGFGAGEQLASATFDGVSLPINATADGNGTLTGVFTVPANIPAGAKTVAFTGRGGSQASAVFVGQGQLTVTTLRQVNTITTVWVDPLAQTFVPDADRQICGVDVWFTASGGDARVQIRDVANGYPGRRVLAEAHVPKAVMVLPSVASVGQAGGHTRVLFDAPVPLAASTEYAMVVMCNDAITAVSVAELGKFDANVQRWITSQPYQVGVLFSSSNASAWTAHQDRDMAFRLLEAVYPAGTRDLHLGSATLEAATDLILISLEETPTARTRIEYALTLPGGEVKTVAAGQPLRFGEALSGGLAVKARLTAEASASPLLWPGTQIIEGAVQSPATYLTRSIPALGAGKASLIYDAAVPSGAAVTPEIQINGGSWQALVVDGTTPQGDGVVEYRFKKPLSNAEAVKVRLTLAGSSLARPRVSNIRLLAVV